MLPCTYIGYGCYVALHHELVWKTETETQQQFQVYGSR